MGLWPANDPGVQLRTHLTDIRSVDDGWCVRQLQRLVSRRSSDGSRHHESSVAAQPPCTQDFANESDVEREIELARA
jgi:hypothetical protein